MNWEMVGAIVVILSVVVNLYLTVFGKPESVKELSEKIDMLHNGQAIILNSNEQINKQIKAQWEKIDMHTEVLVKQGQMIAIIKDRCDRQFPHERIVE